MMLPKRILTAAATAITLAAPVAAEQHLVVMTGFAYFPQVIYAKPGDTVVFLNQSGMAGTIVSKDATWVIGPIQNQYTGSLVVSESTVLEYFLAHGTGSGTDPAVKYGTFDDATIKAEITFEAPILSDG